MTISALQLAGELIRRSATRNWTQTNLSIQKLAYFCHGWHLALANEPLVNEQFEAWRFGPVLPGLYHTLKVFSSNPIPANHPLVLSQPTLPPREQWTAALIDRILEVYGRQSPAQLVAMSHSSEGPWETVWQEEGQDARISNEAIRDYFRQIAQQPAQQPAQQRAQHRARQPA
ncbi:Panacea domain-containing protein [Paraburkholderia sp. MM6662-R1]|uniref:Panacea domain-containing protein n=1 Tax=Paraburkholderia sp. MM6662-R1 TaxID=2991066 RepID=UPI003D1D50A8